MLGQEIFRLTSYKQTRAAGLLCFICKTFDNCNRILQKLLTQFLMAPPYLTKINSLRMTIFYQIRNGMTELQSRQFQKFFVSNLISIIFSITLYNERTFQTLQVLLFLFFLCNFWVFQTRTVIIVGLIQ